MRLLKSLFIAAIAVGLTAASASALVSVTHVASESTIAFDGSGTQTVTVDVIMGYDGADGLSGIFTAASWDESVLRFESATAAPVSIFSLLFNQFPAGQGFPTDASNVVKTIQYAPPASGITALAGPDTLITTLTFSVIGAGDGTVAAIFGADDVILGTAGDISGDAVLTNAAITVVPEPGTALLMGLGLAGLGAAGRRNR